MPENQYCSAITARRPLTSILKRVYAYLVVNAAARVNYSSVLQLSTLLGFPWNIPFSDGKSHGVTPTRSHETQVEKALADMAHTCNTPNPPPTRAPLTSSGFFFAVTYRAYIKCAQSPSTRAPLISSVCCVALKYCAYHTLNAPNLVPRVFRILYFYLFWFVRAGFYRPTWRRALPSR